MSNQLVQLLHQSEVNKVILSTIAKHEGKVGVFSAEDVSELTPEIITYMNDVVEDMCSALKALNQVFIEKNLTADSSLTYVNFLCDLLPQYLEIGTREEIKNIKPHEIEALVNASVAQLSVEEMREGLVENLFLNQNTPDKMTISAISLQLEELDDGTVTESYKTLLMKQYNTAVNTPAEL